MNSAMMKAAAPMMGGVNIPPVEAQASMAPAISAVYPVRFIRGMVKVPVVTTFPTGEPEIIPISALETTAVLAGPPRNRPATEWARSMKNCPPPEPCRKAPKRTNTMM